ncbi:hypothetical protein HCN44_002700 [Aphidius gifuensis]|uniref:Flap endonuclease 1 n=1 Tax=Aphidius gifuensis TaxID=684658 RepID=A0A834XPP3_APHGI|nr:hypothetical protein HCN44_002700 [Aphidius gifuensis]
MNGQFKASKDRLGRKITIDASMCHYQFLIAVRSEGSQLTSTYGETTSHCMGTFYRTIRLVNNDVKPVYVFDGKLPNLKVGKLAKRVAAEEKTRNAEDIDKFNRQLVKVTPEHVNEAKQLLKLMGIPYVKYLYLLNCTQCAALVKGDKVYAAATEDMDALTFGSTVLLCRFNNSEARKLPVQEFHLDFIDFCILLGCDYTGSIKGIGPKRAIELIKTHKSLEKILENIDQKKYPAPEDWNYKEARALFIEPDVADPKNIDLKWTEPDEEGLVKFLCGDKNFNEDRIRNGAKKLAKARTTSTQGRLDGFFKVLSTTPSTKRKAEEKKGPAKRGRGADLVLYKAK